MQDSVLDLVTSKLVGLLISIQGLRFDVVLSSKDLDNLNTKSKKASTVVDVSVNVLGPAESANRVGDILLQHSCFLQHPIFLIPEIIYINPQYFYSGGVKDDLRALIGPAPKAEDQTLSSHLHDGLEDVLASLAEPQEAAESVQNCMRSGLLRTNLKS